MEKLNTEAVSPPATPTVEQINLRDALITAIDQLRLSGSEEDSRIAAICETALSGASNV